MSNSAAFADSSPAPLHCRPAALNEVEPALRLVLSVKGEAASQEQIAQFIAFIEARHPDTSDLWLVENGGRILWALASLRSPGRTALLLGPDRLHHEIQAVAARTLVERLCEHLRTLDVQLAQFLVDPGSSDMAQLYLDCGFRVMAELVYLQSTIRPTAPPALAEGLGWMTYSASAHALFAQAIRSTYEASLDCPGLNGMRAIEDVIEGHKAAGFFDPKRWLLLHEHGRPVGVLLLAASVQGEGMELVYLGIVPSARGRGLGDAMMRQALSICAAQRLSHLTCAVDSGNAPAMRLYLRHGMRRLASKIALMRNVRESSSTDHPHGR